MKKTRKQKETAGDSAIQRGIEGEMLAAFGTRLGVVLSGRRYATPNGAQLEVDGVCEEPAILCEACAHQGSPKSGQKPKIIADALKLVFAEQLLGRPARKIILLADEKAAAAFKGRSWVGEAFSHLGIVVEVADISPESCARVLEAQAQQFR